MFFSGPGAQVSKHLLYKVHRCSVSVNVGTKTIDVHITDYYKHVGTGFLSQAAIAPMLKLRFASIVPTARALRKALFISSTPGHNPKTISVFLQMYRFSKALFDSAVWLLLINYECATIHSHVMRLCRKFYSSWYSH